MFLLIPIAFVAGLLTAFTPCALPVLPVVLGSSTDSRNKIKGVILGLVMVFVLLSLTLASLVQLLGLSVSTIRWLSIGLLLVMGGMMIFDKLWIQIQAQIERVWHPPTWGKDRSDFVGGLLLGGSLGMVWTPCVGPVVGAVTALTASSPFSLISWLIMLGYGGGIGLGLYLIALGGQKAGQKLSLIKQHNQRMRLIFGLIVWLTAAMIALGWDTRLQAWTLQHLPAAWTQAGGFLQNSQWVIQQLDKLTN